MIQKFNCKPTESDDKAKKISEEPSKSASELNKPISVENDQDKNKPDDDHETDAKPEIIDFVTEITDNVIKESLERSFKNEEQKNDDPEDETNANTNLIGSPMKTNVENE